MPLEILLEDIERDGLHNHIDMIYLCKAEDSTLKPQEKEIDGSGSTYDEIEEKRIKLVILIGPGTVGKMTVEQVANVTEVKLLNNHLFMVPIHYFIK